MSYNATGATTLVPRMCSRIRIKYSRMSDTELLEVNPDNIIPEAQALLATEFQKHGWDEDYMKNGMMFVLDSKSEVSRSTQLGGYDPALFLRCMQMLVASPRII